MKMKYGFLLIACILLGSALTAFGQKKAKLGKVCGDPTAACKSRENFQSFDLPFDTGKNFGIYESEKFYGIVLKSVKLKDWGDCENPSFDEGDRMPIQELFPHNKVFALNCVETGTNYYTGVAEQTAFIGVYAGRTLAEANNFLKTVQATGQFPGVKVRRMSIGVNGT
ncbi:MAG: hypothetical protein WBC19_01270 [Pyrinomonadaceae bacterium]|nr:hypothetical protein [Chloracidobacterium sp.]